MRPLKQYLPPLFTLALIALGAAMPWLAAWGQDARTGTRQEKLELNAVNLTLQQDAGVGPALKVAAGEYTAIPWGDETRMTEREAFNAALETIDQMNQYALLPAGGAYLLTEEGGWAEPLLFIAEDGSTALVWTCYWRASPCVVAVDDASGKAVQFLVDSPARWEENAIKSQMHQWDTFFQDYYGAELTESEELMERLSLQIYEEYTTFNCG